MESSGLRVRCTHLTLRGGLPYAILCRPVCRKTPPQYRKNALAFLQPAPQSGRGSAGTPVPGVRSMARHLIAYGLCVLSVVLAEQLLAQDTLSVDLALATNDTVTIDQGRYRILVVNRVPRYRYSIRVAVHAIPMAALDVSPALTRELQSPCPMLASTIDTLAAARREEEVPTALNGIDSAMAKEGSNSACSKLVERGRGLRDSTRVADPDIYKFSVGQYITVKVSRLADGGATARGWERTFTTGSGGAWRVSYGFIFPIVSGLAKHGGLRDEASYFAKQIDTSHYMISQQRTT